MLFVLLFVVLTAVVSFAGALIRPLPLRGSLRAGLLSFLSTAGGMGLIALAIFFMSR